MSWAKRGHVYSVDGRHEWNQSHAQVPVVDVIDNQRWRVYFATRDSRGRSRTSFIEVEAGRPENVLYVHDRPVMELGALGAFDDCGVMPSWILNHDDHKYLYYIGWAVRTTVPYHNSIGLAISDDGGKTFERAALGPLFGSTPNEPFFTGTSCVIREGARWRNWYLSCTRWEEIAGKPEPFYHLKYAESRDGVDWERHGVVAIDFASDDEGGIVKASVLPTNDGYRMWYSYRNGADYRTNPANSYRIGYAESSDGIQWTRRDDAVDLDVSPDGWDSMMLAYPHVIEHDGVRFMFYNGNGFGRTGIGYAIEE